MIKKWEFSYAPCDKDTKRYKVKIDGVEEDLTMLLQKIGNICGRPFIPLDKAFGRVFYVYNVNKDEKQRIEKILEDLCPSLSSTPSNEDLENEKEALGQGSTEDSHSSFEDILDSIVGQGIKEKKSEPKKEKKIEKKEPQIEILKSDIGKKDVFLQDSQLGKGEENGKPDEAAVEVTRQNNEPIKIVVEEKEEVVVPQKPISEHHAGDAKEKTWEPKLNEAYGFDTFVVGANSRFTHAAALAVAENPGKIYNPLFIYGGVGLGKTHLLHAIGNHAKSKNANIKVLYITTEKFIEDVIDAIRQGTVREFRNNCRKYDILLIDDIQFLAEAESTQEEFFHTFNILYDSQKQIVITSDKPPKKLVDLEERLKSRFEWGLTADIKSPNLETRVAILKKKEEDESIKLDDNILLYIASKLKSNIRELEGFLKRINAYGQLTNQVVDLDTIKTLLGELLPDEKDEVEIVSKEEEKEEVLEIIPREKAGTEDLEEVLEREVFRNEYIGSEVDQIKKEQEINAVEQEVTQKTKREEIEELKREQFKKEIILEPPDLPEMPEIIKAPDVPKAPEAPDVIEEEIDENDPNAKLVKVGYFYPEKHENELEKIKGDFASVIEKHKLKFKLKGIFNYPYPIDKKVEYDGFTAMCNKKDVNIAIVLGPPKGSELKESEFSATLRALLFDEKISMQFIPFSDIDKQFRFLNLVLDMVLVSHKR